MRWLKRALLPLTYRLLVLWWFFRRPKTSGAKCLIQHGGDVLLIRHTYGQQGWSLPGGGMNKNESPEQAVVREVREELGIKIENPKYLGSFDHRVSFKRDTVHCFHAHVVDRQVSLDQVEIAEARWFPLSTLPELPPGTDRIIQLFEKS